MSTEEHIRAHFLVCFIALVITRLLEMKLGWKYDALNIIKAIRESEYAWMDRNYFELTKTNPIIQELGEMMGSIRNPDTVLWNL